MKTPLSIILILLYCSAYTHSSNFNCNSVKDCFCHLMGFEYIIDCSSFNVIISPSKTSIQCKNEKINWTSQELPRLNTEIEVFSLMKCPLSDFPEIMKNMEIQIRELKIEYADLNTILYRDLFENTTNLQKLVLNDNNIETIQDDFFKSLNNLTDIDLQSNKVNLTSNMFKYSTELTFLSLAQNELNEIPAGIFQNLQKLKFLYLEGNKLTLLEENTFNQLNNLELLELHNNQMRHLPKNIFKDLKSLVVLNIAMNNLQEIPEDLFVTNTNLQVINLSNNERLMYLPKGLFSSLKRLISVLLNNCKLSRLSSSMFNGSVKLENVFLQHNNLKSLPNQIFGNLTALEYLDLSFNKIMELPAEIFSSLIRLKVLNLERNMLTSISHKLFKHLQKVEVINLKSNLINQIDPKAFKRVIRLKELLLSNNYLTKIENSNGFIPFHLNYNLERVDLSNNNITSIGYGWWANVRLKKLDLSYNTITYVDLISLVEMNQPFLLNLSHNEITTIGFMNLKNIGKFVNFDYHTPTGDKFIVDLNENRALNCDCRLHDFIRYIDESTNFSLKKFFVILTDSLTCNSPTNVAGMPITSVTLDMLACNFEGDTCPEKCKCSFRFWDMAYMIDCRNQNLTTAPVLIPPTTIKMYNQTIVYLQENLLQKVPENNMGYENVTKLYLTSNQINEVTWIPPKIEIFSLGDNNISYLTNKVLSMMNVSTLKNLTLGKNPFHCDCSTVNLTKFLISHLINKQIDVDDIRCKNNGHLLINLSVSDLCSSPITIMLIIGITFMTIVLLIAMCTIYVYHNRLKIKVWLFAHNMCLQFITEEEIDKDKMYDVFISYSHKDENFVLNQLVPTLEKDTRYKLCIHIRDWIAGELIAEQIVKSVKDSRRTLVIVSPNFLKSVWGKMEFRAAHTEAVSEGRARIVVVLYGDIDVEKDLDDELKAYIISNTYVRWGERWFWDKLKYALPHSQRYGQNGIM